MLIGPQPPSSAARTTGERNATSPDETALTYTEHAVYSDGMHSRDVAEHGTGVLLDRLG